MISQKSFKRSSLLPSPQLCWWPTVPLTSWYMKGLWQAEDWDERELISADVAQIGESNELYAVSYDIFGILRLHSFPALDPVKFCLEC